MAKPTVVLPASRESAERFMALAAQGPDGVAIAAKAAGLNFETKPQWTKGRVPPNTIYHEECYSLEEYKGTVEDLIAVGLMERHMQPSKIGRKVNIPSTGAQDPAGRTILWQTPRIVTVWVDVPEEVAKQRRDAEHARMERKREQERRASAGAWLEQNRAKNYQKEIDAMPKSAEQFRTEVAESAAHQLGTLKWLMSRHGKGYHYSEDVMGEVDRLADQIEQLLLEGETGFDQTERDSEIQELRALGAKYNPQLQNLLTAAVAVDLVKHESREPV